MQRLHVVHPRNPPVASAPQEVEDSNSCSDYLACNAVLLGPGLGPDGLRILTTVDTHTSEGAAHPQAQAGRPAEAVVAAGGAGGGAGTASSARAGRARGKAAAAEAGAAPAAGSAGSKDKGKGPKQVVADGAAGAGGWGAPYTLRYF